MYQQPILKNSRYNMLQEYVTIQLERWYRERKREGGKGEGRERREIDRKTIQKCIDGERDRRRQREREIQRKYSSCCLTCRS